MDSKLRVLASMATALLLALNSCTRSKPSPDLEIELDRLKHDYLKLQNEHHELQSKMTALGQENEVFKAGLTAGYNQDKEIKNQLIQTQKNLNSQQREYQALLKDYAMLEASIIPLASRLKAGMAAHRKELIGTKLGKVVLRNGRLLNQVEVTKITDKSLGFKFEGGLIEVKFADLPEPIQQRFFFDSLLVSPGALLSETPDTQKSDTKLNNAKHAQALIEEAFAKRNQQELDLFQVSLLKRIPELEKKISDAKQQIRELKKDRIEAGRIFSQTGGKIKRSSADRENGVKIIDLKISKLEVAIISAEAQIKSWKKEAAQKKSEKK